MDKYHTINTLKIAIGITMVALLLAGGAGASTLTVNASGGADFIRIQDAVNASSNGDTIMVAAGTYNENVDVNKSVSLIGEGAEVTIVNATNPNDHVFNVTASYVTISGFNVTGATQSSKVGIYFFIANNANISNNIAINNYYGIYLTRTANSILKNNNASSNNYGIFFGNSNFNTLTNNTMANNLYNFGESHLSGYSNNIDTSNMVDGKPIYYIKQASDTIYDSSTNAGTFYCINCINVTIRNINLNNNYAGILFSESRNSTIQNVTASNNMYDIYLEESRNNTLFNNTVSDSNYYPNERYGIYLWGSSYNNLTGNDYSYKFRGIELTGSTYNKLVGNYNKYRSGETYLNRNYLGINLYYSNNNILTDNVVESTVYPIRLDHSNTNNLSKNLVEVGEYIQISGSNNILEDNIITRSGIKMVGANNNILRNNTAGYHYAFGLYLQYSNNNTIINNNLSFGDHGIILCCSSDNNSINSNFIVSNNHEGITMYTPYIPNNNSIYNNLFNNTNNFFFEKFNANYWNTTEASRTNIIGGLNLGGNFWANPSGTGFSQTCINSDGDGICDSPYVLDANNTDYLPLAESNILPLIRFINGTLIDSVNKTSITGVTVSANSTLSTTTNAAGFYSFAVSDGSYNLTSMYDIRYYTNTTIVSTLGQAVVIQDIELIKKPTGNITGNVIMCCTLT